MKAQPQPSQQAERQGNAEQQTRPKDQPPTPVPLGGSSKIERASHSGHSAPLPVLSCSRGGHHSSHTSLCSLTSLDFPHWGGEEGLAERFLVSFLLELACDLLPTIGRLVSYLA